MLSNNICKVPSHMAMKSTQTKRIAVMLSIWRSEWTYSVKMWKNRRNLWDKLRIQMRQTVRSQLLSAVKLVILQQTLWDSQGRHSFFSSSSKVAARDLLINKNRPLHKDNWPKSMEISKHDDLPTHFKFTKLTVKDRSHSISNNNKKLSWQRRPESSLLSHKYRHRLLKRFFRSHSDLRLQNTKQKFKICLKRLRKWFKKFWFRQFRDPQRHAWRKIQRSKSERQIPSVDFKICSTSGQSKNSWKITATMVASWNSTDLTNGGNLRILSTKRTLCKKIISFWSVLAKRDRFTKYWQRMSDNSACSPP